MWQRKNGEMQRNKESKKEGGATLPHLQASHLTGEKYKSEPHHSRF
jgi:hypothetical protein